MTPHARRTTAALAGAAALLIAGLAVPAGATPPTGGPRTGALPAPLSASDRAALLAEADAAADHTARLLKLGEKEELVVRDVVRDADGTTHTRYERTYDGLPVLGGDLVVHTAGDGELRGVTRATEAAIAVPTTDAPAATTPKASDAPGSTAPRKVIWAGGDTPVLAWERVVGGVQPDGTPRQLHVVTDARTGEELYRWDAVHTGVGHAMYAGEVEIGTSESNGRYTLTDAARGGQATYDLDGATGGTGTLFTNDTDVWGDGSPSDPATAAVDAHYGAAVTWDYYQQVHGREGIGGDGKGATSRVHYGNNYVNAFWSDACFCMTYGDGENNQRPLTSIDIAGHEMSHGVVSATANLVYSGESGGLNEATADIFGTAVEWHADNSQDTPDYLIGEQADIFGDGSPLRRMDQPSLDGYSEDYWYEGIGRTDVHYSSGVANHFFYLLSEGSGPKEINGVSYDSPTADGQPVEGIGQDAAARIWFRALTVYMTSTTDYHDAREATLQAATDLFGEGSTEVQAVDRAWAAVNVS